MANLCRTHICSFIIFLIFVSLVLPNNSVARLNSVYSVVSKILRNSFVSTK